MRLLLLRKTQAKHQYIELKQTGKILADLDHQALSFQLAQEALDGFMELKESQLIM